MRSRPYGFALAMCPIPYPTRIRVNMNALNFLPQGVTLIPNSTTEKENPLSPKDSNPRLRKPILTGNNDKNVRPAPSPIPNATPNNHTQPTPAPDYATRYHTQYDRLGTNSLRPTPPPSARPTATQSHLRPSANAPQPLSLTAPAAHPTLVKVELGNFPAYRESYYRSYPLSEQDG